MKTPLTSFVLAAALLMSGLPSAHAQKASKPHGRPPMTHAKATVHHKSVSRKVGGKAASSTTPKDTGIKVWVNTKTGVYHMPGQRWYGATKEGQYMTEKEAQAHGYTHTGNGQ